MASAVVSGPVASIASRRWLISVGEARIRSSLVESTSVSQPSHSEFLTVREVAELLKLNQQTVRNWIDRGELPAVRVGARRVRVLRSDLDAMLAAGRIKLAATQAGDKQRPTEGDLREGLDRALRSAQEALAGDSDTELERALERLAVSARALAKAMRPR